MPEPQRLPKPLRTRVAVERTTARCKCTHAAERHNPEKRMCHGSVVCGCAEFRPDDGARWTPARFREGDSFDPSPEPVDRSTR